MAARQSIRVLIVDDDPDCLEMYGRYFDYIGMDVAVASDGCEALQKVLLFEPDVIVMDISMPLIEGDEAAKALRSDPRTRHIGIVALSAFGGLARNKGRTPVFDAFHAKPCLPGELALIVRELAQRRSTATARRRPRRAVAL
jgi:two-component system, cell cycle response regulator DivK